MQRKYGEKCTVNSKIAPTTNLISHITTLTRNEVISCKCLFLFCVGFWTWHFDERLSERRAIFFGFSVLKGLTRRPPALSYPPPGMLSRRFPLHRQSPMFQRFSRHYWTKYRFCFVFKRRFHALAYSLCAMCQSPGSSAYFSAIFTAFSSVMPCFGWITSSCWSLMS